MSEFARTFMNKHGWTEGKGLGANEDGMSQPIKVKFKTDLAGVGYDHAEKFTNCWWEEAFKNASANISVENNSNGVKIATKDEMIKSTKALHLSYKDFVQSGVMVNGVEEKVVDSSSEEDKPIENLYLTDDWLLKACDGRTAHKGARHGIKQSGKLTRLARYDQLFLAKCDSSKTKPKAFKRRKKNRTTNKAFTKHCKFTINDSVANY